ncbi:hypothetical protein [Streptococcus sp. CSL10205-OR2]|uniref:hypothetical protein n=1 Tax=Streptococcus sp. CSL10205-OR2 TaxID=2980558 RepID=UPI0021D9F051|nr:hypothetical protein [Streptococcus sp. CSL10205-OR2]MCU9533517.1 hypothetical protein [Streptococcus sp. CSL10205-OR2]
MYTIKTKYLVPFNAIDDERAIFYDRLRKQYVIASINRYGMDKKLAVPGGFYLMIMVLNRSIHVDSFSMIFVFYFLSFLLAKLVWFKVNQQELQIYEDYFPQDDFYKTERKNVLKGIIYFFIFFTISLVCAYISYTSGLFMFLVFGSLAFVPTCLYASKGFYQKIFLLW